MNPKDLERKIKDLEKQNQDLSLENKILKHKAKLLANWKLTAIDVTDQKIAENKLRESELKLREIYNSTSEAILIHDMDQGNVTDCNERTVEMYGYDSKEEILNKPIRHFSANEKSYDEETISKILKKTKSLGQQTFEWKALKKNGETFWVEVSLRLTSIGGEGKILAAVRDISERKAAENALKKSESMFRTIFNESPIGIEIYQADGLQINANKASLNMFGISSFSDLESFNLFDGTSLSKESKRKLKNGETINYQATFDFDAVRKLGQYDSKKTGTREFDYIICPLHASKKEIAGYMVMIQDITEQKRAEEKLRLARKEAEESEQKLRSMIENTLTGILFCDPHGNILEANPAVLEIMGSPSLETSLEVNLLDYKPLQEVGFSQNFKKCLKIKQLVSDETEYTSRYGKHLYLKYFVMPIFSEGKAVGVWINIHDLTDLWKFQNELKEAKEKAEESDRLKTAFLANMSHEIRTPMNGILGFADLLKEPELSGEEQKRYISVIEKSGQRMLNILNDLINISKLEAGQVDINYSETNVNAQLEYLYNFFKPEADKKEISLKHICSLPTNEAYIFTDQEKVYAILTNLIKNAFKYTSKGSISFGYYPKNEFVEFFVTDTGIGIPEERQETVFERFTQAHAYTSGEYQGAGLGLAICKAYTELLGGKIWLKSKPGKGSSFFFSIPLKKDDSKQLDVKEETYSKSPVDIQELKVLIAEDDSSSREYLNKLIEPISQRILLAKDGQEVIELLKENADADLILMDIKMPRMDGYETTKKIRGFNQDVVIIAQTAFALEGDREKAIEAGCNDYISKPIDKAKLRSLLEKHFTRRR